MSNKKDKKEAFESESENIITDNASETTENESADDAEIKISDADLIAEANKKADEYKNLVRRVQAEFDNYRKRNAESITVSRNDGINDVISTLFPVLDNFERGINTITDESTKSGMELIYKQILSILKKFDVEEIIALGEEFNPKYHHAIAQCEDEENANKVVEVYQKGYKRKEKVLRASMVKVAQ